MIVLILLLLYVTDVRTWRGFYEYDNSRWYAVGRLVHIMRTYYYGGEERIKNLNAKKFQIEQTREFEEGFLMGEIIERYRMMVENVHAMHKFNNFAYYDCVLRMEQIQKYYMEVFHLVNMMHEVPRKYGFETRVRAGKGPKVDKTLPDNIEDLTRVMNNMKGLDKTERKRLREHMAKLKLEKEKALLHQQWTPFTTKSQTRWWWPLEYGWEIDYYW